MIRLQGNPRKGDKKTLRDHMCDKGIHTLGPRISITVRKKKHHIILESEGSREEFAQDYKLSETRGNDLIFIKRHESKRRCKNCRQLITVSHKEEHGKIQKKAAEKLQEASV